MTNRGFDALVVPHLDAAFNYARWLTKNDADAEDLVQDAAVRALRFLSTFRGESAKAWLLTIVRNVWSSRMARQAGWPAAAEYDDVVEGQADDRPGPDALLAQRRDVARVRRAVEGLPVEFREVIVLREFEGLSYKEIAAIAGMPIGTVMSRLARARERLGAALSPEVASGGTR
jgi:RNA polymerase sigma-70 factor (ECF subfamily)